MRWGEKGGTWRGAEEGCLSGASAPRPVQPNGQSPGCTRVPVTCCQADFTLLWAALGPWLQRWRSGVGRRVHPGGKRGGKTLGGGEGAGIGNLFVARFTLPREGVAPKRALLTPVGP